MEEADPNKDEVFISGLPLDITEKEIAEYFGQIGIIKEVGILKRDSCIWIWGSGAWLDCFFH